MFREVSLLNSTAPFFYSLAQGTGDHPVWTVPETPVFPRFCQNPSPLEVMPEAPSLDPVKMSELTNCPTLSAGSHPGPPPKGALSHLPFIFSGSRASSCRNLSNVGLIFSDPLSYRNPFPPSLFFRTSGLFKMNPCGLFPSQVPLFPSDPNTGQRNPFPSCSKAFRSYGRSLFD